jgi:hypothetical protein
MVKSNPKLDIELEDRSTTIRLNESTKRLLASVAMGQESFNDTIKRLVTTYKNLNENGPEITKKHNAIGTTYERMRKTFDGLNTPYGPYDVVCSFNDVRAISVFRFNKALILALNENVRGSIDWTLDLEILDLHPKGQPNVKSAENIIIKGRFYFFILERLFKEVLQIPTYGFISEADFYSWDKWKEFYTQNNLPQESFEKDIEKKLRDIEFDGKTPEKRN